MSDLLIIDDDAGFAESIAGLARTEGFSPRLAATVAQAREALRVGSDVLLLDIQLPDGSGLDLLAEIDPALHPRVAVITGHPSVETAARAVSGPVNDYFVKPFDPMSFVAVLRESRRVSRTVEVPGAEPIPGVVAASAAMREPTRLARALAATEVALLLTGETGAGKDMFARAIHAMSGRSGAFVRLDCGSMPPEHLIERLLGSRRGEGQGAGDVFAEASDGTLFLDEVSALPAGLQGALLRRIESADELEHMDVRIIAATRLDPRVALAEGRLREDLYFRIAEVHIPIPPLRQRDEDVLLLARRFVDAFNRRYDLEKRLSPQSARTLRRHPWPGNVRELRNVVHRAYLLAPGEELVMHLEAARMPPPLEVGDTLAFTLGTPWAEIERRMLIKALEHCGNDKTAAARLLGVSVRTVHNHLARMKQREHS
ncbi:MULTISPECIES: sigma-54 dependent transcriptional regulator [Luteimonas]|uniref:sigma-54-dependent transcriptional regulator n=1 Tax=Luteimonas TaxID=83614 RepID=UPI000F4E9E59|nr:MULTISPECIES: sigma-54 dependent transcriptional regulator [Luteimonas]